MKRNKIGIVLPSTPAYSETFFMSKIKGLQQYGHEVVLITSRKDSKFDLCKNVTHPKIYKSKVIQMIMMLKVFFSLSFHYKSIFTYYKLEKEQKTPVKRILEKIYLNGTLLKLKLDWLHFGFATMSIERELVAKAIGAKMAVSFRGFDISIFPLKNKGCYNLLWKTVDKVHTISDDLLEKGYGLGLSKNTSSKKITPAIDVNFFSPYKKRDKNPKIEILTVARLHWKKGIIDTLEALSLFKKMGFSFNYSIIGSGAYKEIERIKYAIYELDLEDSVNLIGKKEPEGVLEYYEKSDLYIQYSISEGFCNAVLEAQAMGLLCFVSDAEGLPENVIHNQTGWVVQRKSPKLLADALKSTILTSETDKRKVIEKAIKRVKTQFSIKSQQEAFNQFYLN